MTTTTDWDRIEKDVVLRIRMLREACRALDHDDQEAIARLTLPSVELLAHFMRAVTLTLDDDGSDAAATLLASDQTCYACGAACCGECSWCHGCHRFVCGSCSEAGRHSGEPDATHHLPPVTLGQEAVGGFVLGPAYPRKYGRSLRGCGIGHVKERQ